MRHYKTIKVTINTFNLLEVIMDKIIQYHDLFDLIVSN